MPTRVTPPHCIPLLQARVLVSPDLSSLQRGGNVSLSPVRQQAVPLIMPQRWYKCNRVQLRCKVTLAMKQLVSSGEGTRELRRRNSRAAEKELASSREGTCEQWRRNLRAAGKELTSSGEGACKHRSGNNSWAAMKQSASSKLTDMVTIASQRGDKTRRLSWAAMKQLPTRLLRSLKNFDNETINLEVQVSYSKTVSRHQSLENCSIKFHHNYITIVHVIESLVHVF